MRRCISVGLTIAVLVASPVVHAAGDAEIRTTQISEDGSDISWGYAVAVIDKPIVSVAAGTITLWAQIQLSEKMLDGNTRVIDAQLIAGNIDTFRASWRLTPVDEGARTEVVFKLYVDPALPLPSSLFSRQNEKAAGKTVQALRAQVAGV